MPNSILATRPKYLRAPKSKGSAPKVDPRGGYRKQGIIRGVSIVTSGEALGHDMWLDADFLQSVADGVNASNKGVKARFTHPSLSGDGLGSFLGRAMDAKVEGLQVFADLHFSATSHSTPDGDLATYVMDLASEEPESFGVSIVFEPDMAAEGGFVAQHSDERGTFTSPDTNNQQNLPHARLASLRAADVVDEPAANPDGLFHREQQIAQQADALASYAIGLTDSAPELVALGLDADRVTGFVHRFLEQHNLEIVKMADQPKPENVPAEVPATPQLQAADFLKSFGTDGAVWFAEGKSYAEAQALHDAKQADRLKAADERLAAIDAKIDEKFSAIEQRLAALASAGGKGETTPIEFGSGEGKDQKRKGFASRFENNPLLLAGAKSAAAGQ